MSISPDIRPACGQQPGSKPPTFLRGCTQHHFSNFSSSVKIKRNVTQLLNYANPATPTWIDVVPTAEARTAPDCSPYNSGDPFFFVCGDGVNGNLWCYSDINDSFFQTCTGDTHSFDVAQFHNCYVQTNETQSITTCRDLGFKNVYASKTWSGKYAYNSRMNNQADWFDWCCGCSYHDYDGTADHTKYLSISANSSVTNHTNYFCCGPSCDCGGGCPDCGPCGGALGGCGTYDPCCGNPAPCPECDACTSCTANGSNDWSGNASAASHVDIYGNQYADGCSSGSGCPGSYPQCCGGSSTPTADDIAQCEQWWAGYAFGLLGEANSDINTIVSTWCSFLTNQGNPDVVTGDGTGWHIEFHDSYDCFDACGNITSTNTYSRLTMDISVGGTVTITMNGLKPPGFNSGHCPSDGYCPSVTQTYHETITYGGTSYNRSLTVTGIGSWSFNDTYSETVNGSLATPYTTTDVYNDIIGLLGTWDFGDPDVYPWRDDTNVTKGPYVSHDEGSSAPSVPFCTSSINFTGEIRGRPGPIGIDRVWDPNHKNWCTCDSSVQPGCLAFYIKDYGEWSTACGVPRATQWLDTYQSNNIPQGAFVQSNLFWTFPSTCNSNGPTQVHDDTMWACKYAEVIFPKQSYNFARPCGLDRYQITESFGNCIIDTTGGTLTLEPMGPVAIVNNGDYAWVCGTGIYDGCWIVSGVGGGGYTVTLQEPRIVSASNLPLQPVTDCGTGMIMKLRWQNLQPAICGRLDITAATATNPVTITLEEPSYLGNGDHIYIEGASGMNINGYWEVQATSNNTDFVLVGSSGTGSYKGGGMARSPFAADWKWDDTTSKNEFSILKWQYNFRDAGEYYRVVGTDAWNAGLVRCDGITTCPGPTPPPEPRPYQAPCGMDQNLESMTCQTDCLPFTACQATAVYFSPNAGSESFTKPQASIVNSKNYGFFNPGIDTQYGTLWQAMVKQSMDDPLFTRPPCPCTPVLQPDEVTIIYECDCSILEDDGFCEGDQAGDPDLGIPCIKYFPSRDQFEARCEPPEGAPAMPPGSTIGCLGTDKFQSPTCPQGNICGPPFAPNTFPYSEGCNPYLVYPWAIPWNLLQRKEFCVCYSGRFADNYIANGIRCPFVIPPP